MAFGVLVCFNHFLGVLLLDLFLESSLLVQDYYRKACCLKLLIFAGLKFIFAFCLTT